MVIAGVGWVYEFMTHLIANLSDGGAAVHACNWHSMIQWTSAESYPSAARGLVA